MYRTTYIKNEKEGIYTILPTGKGQEKFTVYSLYKPLTLIFDNHVN